MNLLNFLKTLWIDFWNKKYFDFLNITTWHSQGYYGKGIRVLTAETNGDNHDLATREIFKYVAPQSELQGFDFTLSRVSSLEDLAQHAKENDIPLMFRSLGVYSEKDVSSIYDRIFSESENFSIFNSIGNEGEFKHSNFPMGRYIHGVGSVRLVGEKLTVEDYSSYSEYLEFMSLANLHTEHYLFGFSGTSCSAPLLTGMCALVQEKCMIDNGKLLNNTQLFEFVKDNCVDIGEDGKDIVSGYGVFILPNPQDINWEKYFNN